MEGVFAFFLESSFLGILLFGEKRLGQKIHLLSAWLVFLGSWLSAYFILSTNAWMQHPIGFRLNANNNLELIDIRNLLFNPWLFWQFFHNMVAAVITSSFVVCSVGAFYKLSNQHIPFAAIFLKHGIVVGLLATILVIFPTGDGESKQVFTYQPTKAAAMEGIFHTEKMPL